MLVRDEIHDILLSHFGTEEPFSVKQAWGLVGPEHLTTTPDCLRVHLDRLVRDRKMARKERKRESGKGNTRRVFYYVPAKVESAPAEEPLAEEREPTMPVRGEGLEEFFRMIRDALLERDVVAFSVTEEGNIKYEQRVVRKRSLSLT